METPAEEITPRHYLVRSPFLAWRVIENEAVIISPQERELHSLNEVGTYIWNLADGSRTIEEIAHELARRYEVTPEEVLTDTIAFAQALVERGVAFVSERPTSEDEIEQMGVN